MYMFFLTMYSFVQLFLKIRCKTLILWVIFFDTDVLFLQIAGVFYIY
jgi:hypothetical protein